MKIDLIKLIWIAILHNRLLIISHVLFSIFNILFFLNPYVNNSGDFITTSNYLIFVGLVFTFLWSFYAAKMLSSQLNIKLLKERNFTLNEVYSLIIPSLMLIFLLFHFLAFLILNIYYSFLIGFSIDMILHISSLYINYFFLSFLVSFLIGVYFGILYQKFSLIHKALLLLLFIIFLILYILDIEKNVNNFNIFIVYSNGYYNPFTGIENFNYVFFMKILIVIFVIGILLNHLKFGRKRTKILTNLLLSVIFMAFSFLIFNRNYQANMDTYYVDSYISEYEKNKTSNNTHYFHSEDYYIDYYDIQLNGKNNPTFKVDVSLKKIKKKDLRFYINEAFKISNITSNNSRLLFKQQGNTIHLSLLSTEDQVVTFIYSSKGTSLNPVQKNYIFLPYFFNWLPSESNVKDYFVRNDTTVEFNPQERNCNGIKRFHSDVNDLFIQFSSNKKCLTIVKGDLIEKKENEKRLYYPKVWSGNVGAVSDYVDMMDKATKLFNEVFKENKSINYDSLLIIPKYEINAQPSVNDIWIQDNYQIILMDPFLNINKESLFKYISKKSIFNLPYTFLRDKIVEENEKKVEMLSLLFAIYFIEKNNIPKEETYLDYFISQYESRQVKEFLKLDLSQQEDRLVQIYESL